MEGLIHSVESFGTLDGPGIRCVIFMQGCPLRCQYCHNPDTWEMGVGTKITPEEIIKGYKKNASFYTKGGITVTGGEPLVQIDFLIELFSLAKKENIHTCIDTSGITYNPENSEYLKKLDTLLSYTDLVMLDIKHIDNSEHKKLTGAENKNILLFAKYLESKNIDLWIRHVVISGITDNPEHLYKLGEFIGALKNLKALDILPYHTLGVGKYKELGIKYPLCDIPPLSQADAQKAKEAVLRGINNIRAKK